MFAVSNRSIGIAVFICLLAGCGSETYERRLEETRRYFSYLESLDKGVSPSVWRSGGIQLRVPISFQPLTLEEDSGNDSDSGSPTVVIEENGPRIPLPGFEAAWKAPVRVNGYLGPEQGTCYLYLLSNRRLLENEDRGEASGAPFLFQENTVDEIWGALGITTNVRDWEQLTVPSEGAYSHNAPRTIRHDTLGPEPEFPYTQLSFYLASVGDLQLVALFVMPKGVAPEERLPERIALSFETLQVAP